MQFEETVIHEAGHAVIWELESKYLGPVALVSALPQRGSNGRVRGVDGVPRDLTPRGLRALGYLNAAGPVAEKLAGLHLMEPAIAKDARNLARLACFSKRGRRFIEECCAGAELTLRLNWGAVERVAERLRTLGELTQPYGTKLVHMVMQGPPHVLAPDLERFAELLATVAHLPEFASQIEDAARALNTQAA